MNQLQKTQKQEMTYFKCYKLTVDTDVFLGKNQQRYDIPIIFNMNFENIETKGEMIKGKESKT